MLSDFQVTIPEIGTIKAAEPPIVDHHLEPHARDPRRAEAPLLLLLGRLPECRARARDPQRKAPGASRAPVAARSSALCRSCATMDLFKLPGIAETIDWAEALMQLDVLELTPAGDQRHAGRAAQIPGRHRPDPGQRGGAPARPGQGRDRRRPREAKAVADQHLTLPIAADGALRLPAMRGEGGVPARSLAPFTGERERLSGAE